MQKSTTLALILLTFLLFSGCSTKQFTDIADVRNYPQNPLDYVDKPEERNISGTFYTKDELQKDFETSYFSPWSLKRPPFDVQEAKWPWQSYTALNSFKENQQPMDESWFQLMAFEADLEKFGRVSRPGIMTHISHVRNFPTEKPLFKDFEKAGEGYAFDYNLNTIINASEPVFISHYSKTKEWAYIVTSYTSGWVLSDHVALIASDVVRKWSQSRQTILLEDDLPLYDLNGDYVANTRIGMMLPIMKVENDDYQAILATSKTAGYVTFTIVRVPKNISISEFLPINDQAIAIMAEAFMNKAYGWGGLYGNRDCSSTLQEMFKAFSVWLPRNSKKQSEIGRIIDISQLNDKEKERAIIDNAIAFQTLLYKPGHIMLYIGEENGKAMVFHNMWGITTKNNSKEERYVVGRTIISTLRPGKELAGYVKESSLLSSITSMNIITMRPSEEPIVIAPQKEVKAESERKRRSVTKQEVSSEAPNANIETNVTTAAETPVVASANKVEEPKK